MFVFDFEVFMHDWMVVFKDVYSGEYTKIVNNAEELKTFYGKNKKKIFFGYNNKSTTKVNKIEIEKVQSSNSILNHEVN